LARNCQWQLLVESGKKAASVFFQITEEDGRRWSAYVFDVRTGVFHFSTLAQFTIWGFFPHKL
jgi:hypothetical protein